MSQTQAIFYAAFVVAIIILIAWGYFREKKMQWSRFFRADIHEADRRLLRKAGYPA